MRPRPACPSVLFLVLGSACIFDSERRPAVDVNLGAASAYVFRGQTMTERPVLQAATELQLATADGGTGTFGGFGNLDLTDQVGDAWFDGGHAGEFTQMDLWAAYGRSFGGVDTALGLRYYSWPDNASFPFQPFPSTSELFARVGGELGGFRPALTAHYDIDEVESLYVRADVARDLELSKTLRLELQAWLGWSDAEHSQWLYRTDASGFADCGGSLGIALDLDPVTTARLAVAGSTIVDSSMRSWFDDHIDADVVWLTASVGWAF